VNDYKKMKITKMTNLGKNGGGSTIYSHDTAGIIAFSEIFSGSSMAKLEFKRILSRKHLHSSNIKGKVPRILGRILKVRGVQSASINRYQLSVELSEAYEWNESMIRNIVNAVGREFALRSQR
jgi:hypothetical protein